MKEEESHYGVTWHANDIAKIHHAFYSAQLEIFPGTQNKSVCGRSIVDHELLAETQKGSRYCISCIKLLNHRSAKANNR